MCKNLMSREIYPLATPEIEAELKSKTIFFEAQPQNNGHDVFYVRLTENRRRVIKTVSGFTHPFKPLKIYKQNEFQKKVLSKPTRALNSDIAIVTLNHSGIVTSIANLFERESGTWKNQD